jgi:hypothetical protein
VIAQPQGGDAAGISSNWRKKMKKSLAFCVGSTFCFAAFTACSTASPQAAGGAPSGGQTGSEMPGCVEVVRTPLDRDEESLLGFRADEVLAFVAGEHTEVLTWEGGTNTDLTITVSYLGGAVEHIESEWRENGTEMAADDCPDMLSVEVHVQATTTDGALDETWTTHVFATTSAAAHIGVTLEPDDFQGTLDVARFAPDADDLDLYFYVGFDSVGISGELSGFATKIVSSSSQGVTLSGTPFGVATFLFRGGT